MVYRRVLRTLFPETCPRCGGATTAGFCGGCSTDFPRVDAPCPRCGLRAPVAACPRLKLAWTVEAVIAPYAYAGALKQQVLALKFRAARSLGRPLGLLVADAVAKRARGVDLLLPVPLHRRKLRERGYNQAVEIARGVRARLGVPLIRNGLHRGSAGPPQTALGAAARRANLEHAFASRRVVRGLRIALVDDVVTTGATINACARALLDAGAAGVEAWAVARTDE